jgi:hypothetical protein
MAVQDPHIYPTHECFNDALDFISDVLIQNPDDREALVEELLLVHGICLAPDGQPYAHAWVQDGDRCIFCGILDGTRGYFAASRDEYYAEMRVQDVTRYPVHEALRHNRRTRHYGPWLPKYRALCRTTDS